MVTAPASVFLSMVLHERVKTFEALGGEADRLRFDDGEVYGVLSLGGVALRRTLGLLREGRKQAKAEGNDSGGCPQGNCSETEAHQFSPRPARFGCRSSGHRWADRSTAPFIAEGKRPANAAGMDW